MARNKTTATRASVSAFIAGIEDQQKRKDRRALMKMMREGTDNRAKLWGPSIVGFGSYDYGYASGRCGTRQRPRAFQQGVVWLHEAYRRNAPDVSGKRARRGPSESPVGNP